MPRVWRTFCSTNSSVTPISFARRMTAKFSLTRIGDSPSDGSSTRSSRGSGIRPRPIEIIACSPPDMVPASWAARSASRGKIANTFSMRERILASCVSRYAPRRRFSATVSFGKTRRPSGMQARPRATMACVGRPAMSAPSKTMRPRRGAVRPRMARMSVDFPEPLEPRMQVIDPASTASDTSRSTSARSYPTLMPSIRRRAAMTPLLRAQVGDLDLPIGGDLGVGAFGDLAAIVEHRAALAHALDDVHLVLDNDDGQAGQARAHRQEIVHQLARFLVRHSRRRLVQQQQARLRDQRAADLDAAPVDHAERAGRVEHAPGKPRAEGRDQSARLGKVAFEFPSQFRSPEQVEPQTVMQSAVVADHDVVEHGERQPDPRALKRAGDASGVDALRRHAGQVLAAEWRAAAGGPVNAGDDVEQRRLARAVRADEA